MGAFPAKLLLLALTVLCLAREELESVIAIKGSSLSSTCDYDKYKNSQWKTLWCKVMPNGRCDTVFPRFPASERNYLNHAPKRRISITDSGTGCISVSMTDLQLEDSGTYLCGVSEHLNIPLKKINVEVYYEAPVTLNAEEGDSISLNCSYPATYYRRHKNFTWCKMVNATRCHPVVSVEYYQIVNTQGRTKIKIDWRNSVLTVMLAKLQLHDSGKYHCENHLQGSTILLKMITLNVFEKYDYSDTVNEVFSRPAIQPTVASNKDQRTLYIILALGSLLAGSALIATISLTAFIFTKRRKRGDGLGFGGQPNCRLATQQKDESNLRDATPDGELKNSILHAMLSFQPKPKPDNITYANLEPLPKPEVIKRSVKPLAVLFTSGTVDYANIIFEDSSPQSGTKEKQTSPN